MPPGQMYDAFLLRYRLQPDVRFATALGFLAAMERDKEKRLALGEMLWSGDELIIPLLKKGKRIDVLHTALPLTFARMLEALENWMQLLEKHGYSFALSDAPVLQLPYTSAIAAISQVDQRRILNGLAALDQLWRTGGPNRNLLEAAIRGYVLLQVTMRPDPLQRSDTLAGDSLGMLALARHGRPAAAAGAAFMVARLMGYGRYASALTLPDASKRVLSDESLLLAYFQKDRSALQKMNGQDPSTLSRYLLARLLTDSEDRLPAYELYKRIGREHPYGFPWLSESFYVNTLNASKQTTLTYPLLILNQIVPPVEKSPAKEALMGRYSQAFLGNPPDSLPSNATDAQKDGFSEADISFEAFDKLLAQWRPFTDAEASGVFMDNGKARQVMRALYEGAMEQRFKLLFINWNVIDAAYAFSSSLLGKDKQHRLAKHYLAQALIGKGNSSDAARYAAEIFHDGRTSGQFAYDVYSTLQQLRKTAGLASGMARKLDSRPAFQGLLGNVFFFENNPHMAASFYEKAARSGNKQLWLLKNIQKNYQIRHAAAGVRCGASG